MGQSPNQGRSPPGVFKVDGGAEPRLTSGGEAVAMGVLNDFRARVAGMDFRARANPELDTLTPACRPI